MSSSAVALAEAGFTRIPSNGTYVLNNTIEKLIAINQESSQRMEQLTGEIKLLNEKLVTYTQWLLLLTIILIIFAFIDVIQFVIKFEQTTNKRLMKSKDKELTLVTGFEKYDYGENNKKIR